MPQTSNRDVSNRNYSQVEPLISVDRLKATYLFGVTAHDDQGNLLDDTAIQVFINNAISMIEHDLDLAIMPRLKTERKDYYANDYQDWGYLQLNNTPVISLAPVPGATTSGLRIVYLQGSPGNDTVLDIPPQWIRLDPDSGIIRLIPNNQFPGRLAVGSGGSFFPELFNRLSVVPGLWEVSYYHGFKEGCVPSLLNAAVGLLASIYYMNIAGDLVIGAGIAGTSLSLDGLSQSIQTTASAENHAYSAKIKDYNRVLFGDKTLGSTGIIDSLRRFYKGQTMNII